MRARAAAAAVVLKRHTWEGGAVEKVTGIGEDLRGLQGDGTADGWCREAVGVTLVELEQAACDTLQRAGRSALPETESRVGPGQAVRPNHAYALSTPRFRMRLFAHVLWPAMHHTRRGITSKDRSEAAGAAALQPSLLVNPLLSTQR